MNPNPEVAKIISDPRNVKDLQDAIGITDFNIPGEDDREKQLEEIKLMIMQIPVPNGMGPQGVINKSSVDVEPTVDNHPIHAAVCRGFLVSEPGRQLKKNNPDAYENIMLHMQEHMQLMAPPGMPPMGGPPPGGMPPPPPTPMAPPSRGNVPAPKGSSTPLAENKNVQVQS